MSPDTRKKRTFLFVAAGITVAAIIAVAAYYASFNSLTSKSTIANETNGNDSSKLNLASVKVYDINHNEIGKLESNQSFKVKEPVFIKSEFSNPNNNPVEYIIAKEIRKDNETQALTTIQTTLIGSGNVSMEVYWKPEQTGDYTLLIFAYKPEELNRGPVIAPVAIIPLQVTE
jgi:hypothetical protein